MDKRNLRPREVVMAYIEALDNQKYQGAMALLSVDVRIRGPTGETFGEPHKFVDMLRKYGGRYDVKRLFDDGADVCVLYDFESAGATVYMSSWYQVKDGKIVSIQTAFDPTAFGPPPGTDSTEGAGR